jgi:hypothetical protein
MNWENQYSAVATYKYLPDQSKSKNVVEVAFVDRNKEN